MRRSPQLYCSYTAAIYIFHVFFYGSVAAVALRFFKSGNEADSLKQDTGWMRFRSTSHANLVLGSMVKQKNALAHLISDTGEIYQVRLCTITRKN